MAAGMNSALGLLLAERLFRGMASQLALRHGLAEDIPWKLSDE